MMKTIGIIGAMPSELVDIRKGLPNSEIQKKAGFDYYLNQVGDTRVVHVCSGIAKVNAAVCTQALIDTFQPDAILNAGIAGGMNPEVHVCDVVVSSEVLPHDLDLHFLKDYPPYCGIYPAGESLIALARKTCEEFGVKVFTGRIVSGDEFVTDSARKADIQSRLTPYAVDMESAAVGQCAYRNQVPYASIRCISDNADDEGAMSFDQFEKIAAKRVADIVLRMVEHF
ncbi:5'-methylthioadenosine/adenosylhomocysteine nucleosidase [uncultured Ruminococcus sp.]|uniref:5'-methylthioadenosine/adenosylhomocysteine nucleosidase n=1 Tax=uncultured Ruminococcus sp. TaxID=165186 RepID=UPI0026DC25B6|nr:5'-methylthioadenosine/adenosylhomocysteine nucleosidase [uncultured Ruminococcus sp.]